MMQAAAPPLEDLRREVDRIDEAILDLLIERGRVVERIALVKGDRQGGRPAIRPAREAAILRRLAERAGGAFPRGATVRLWRELLAATTRMQAPLSVAVHVPADNPAFWDLARDHFGSYTPMQRQETSSQALRAASEGRVSFAVLPLPEEHDPWWRALLSGGSLPLRVVAKLPFGPPGHGIGEDMAAFVVGRLEDEPSGDDVTLLAIETVADLSRARLKDLLQAVGLDPRWLAVWREAGTAQHLVEVDGFLDDGDSRLAAALAASRNELLRLLRVGVYARPLAAGA